MDAVTTSAVIGAGSALAGVCLSQVLSMIQASAERKYRQKTLLREKLEDLTEHLVQTSRWLDVWFHERLLKSTGAQKTDDSPRSSAEARRVYVLSLLYFPHLIPESQRLKSALDTLHFLSDEPQKNSEKLEHASKDFTAAKKSVGRTYCNRGKKANPVLTSNYFDEALPNPMLRSKSSPSELNSRTVAGYTATSAHRSKNFAI